MKTAAPPIRMVFEMTREDHPRLYDDLIRFPKGTKRVNRLRTLAHDGLLIETGITPNAMLGIARGSPHAGVEHGALTGQIFEEPLQE